MNTFVKSAGTTTSVESSRSELEKVLSRHQCAAFGYERHEDGTTRVTFKVPNHPGSKDRVPVQLEVRPKDVYVRLYTSAAPGKPHYVGRRWVAAGAFDPDGLAQAERVAWRHLVLWVDAACVAASAGLTTIEEAFFAHRLMTDEEGRVGRVIDYIRGITADTGAGSPKLLGAGT